MIANQFGVKRYFMLATVLGLLTGVPSVVWSQSSKETALQVPAKSVPVPDTVSPQLAKIIGMPLRNGWDVLPKTGEE